MLAAQRLFVDIFTDSIQLVVWIKLIELMYEYKYSQKSMAKLVIQLGTICAVIEFVFFGLLIHVLGDYYNTVETLAMTLVGIVVVKRGFQLTYKQVILSMALWMILMFITLAIGYGVIHFSGYGTDDLENNIWIYTFGSFLCICGNFILLGIMKYLKVLKNFPKELKTRAFTLNVVYVVLALIIILVNTNFFYYSYKSHNSMTVIIITIDIFAVCLLVFSAIVTNKNLTLNKALAKELDEKNRQLKETLDTLKSTQEKLVQSKKMAALGGLVAGVAHEINTPVGVSVTAASYIQQKSEKFLQLFHEGKIKKSELYQYIYDNIEGTQMVMANLKRTSELVETFKQVAASHSGQEKRKFKLKAQIEESLFTLKPYIGKTRQKTKIICDKALEVEGDPGALSQLITNLVMNSLVHAYDQEDEGQMIIDIQEKDGTVILIYSDDGKGIQKDHLDRIFDPFFTTKRGQGGTGLGLHIVYNIVTQTFKGTIQCESSVGKGTQFLIAFPKNGGEV